MRIDDIRDGREPFDPDFSDEAEDVPTSRTDENGVPLGESLMREVEEIFGDDEVDGRTPEERDPAVTPQSEDGAR
jgi:hypothetical protein